ncbi:MAG: carbohydrate ABC transporter permease [Spirochaetales bacterium]|nr:carbohydrate ABC transporter permease [Spirochaetales bacterium]
MKMKQKNTSSIIAIILVTITLVMVIAPFIWLIYSSLKTNKEFMASVWKLPAAPQWENFKKAWGGGSLGTYTINSLIVTAVSVFLTVIISTLAGYAMWIFKLKKWMNKIQLFLVITMTIPAYASLVPLVETLRAMSLLDTLTGVILPTVAFNTPMSIFIMRSTFFTLPFEVIEAARFDGASEPVIFTKIAVPLVRPAMFTTAIINMIWVWNDFLFPLVFINNPNLKTLPVGLKDFVGEHVTNYPVMMAAILIASMGAFVIYSIFQKQVIGGLTGGAVKG